MNTNNKETFIIPALNIIELSIDEIIATSFLNNAMYGDNEIDYGKLNN